MKIPFNKPYLSGKETDYIREAILFGKISGDGLFTDKCHTFFQEKYGYKKCLLTTSCTDALEMSAILLNLKEGDEVIVPSYTFVSTANAFVLRGAKIVFADSELRTGNINVDLLEPLITPRTKAIVLVHYAGIACDMNKIMALANRYNLFVVEDAAQAIDSYYEQRPLGSIGHLATLSFHETKNIISGEGGMLIINDERFIQRAEIIREKGTNRSQFFRGEVDKYGWMDIGSSFLPSDLVAAFLYAQLENLDDIQEKRKQLWQCYRTGLNPLANNKELLLPFIPDYATNNSHLFYILCRSLEERAALISQLKNADVHAVFHYQSLHKSAFYKDKHDGRELPVADILSDRLLRLPMFYELTLEQVEYICRLILNFYRQVDL